MMLLALLCSLILLPATLLTIPCSAAPAPVDKTAHPLKPLYVRGNTVSSANSPALDHDTGVIPLRLSPWDRMRALGCQLYEQMHTANLPENAHSKWRKYTDLDENGWTRRKGSHAKQTPAKGGVGWRFPDPLQSPFRSLHIVPGPHDDQAFVRWMHDRVSDDWYRDDEGRVQHYNPTFAEYRTIFIPLHGIIATTDFVPPRAAIRLYRDSLVDHFKGGDIVPLGAWSDITFLEWMRQMEDLTYRPTKPGLSPRVTARSSGSSPPDSLLLQSSPVTPPADTGVSRPVPGSAPAPPRIGLVDALPAGSSPDPELHPSNPPTTEQASQANQPLRTVCHTPCMRIEYVFFTEIQDLSTEHTVEQILKRRRLRYQGPPRWPGLSFSAECEEGQTLLGTRIGSSVADMLIQHREELGHLVVESIGMWEDNPAMVQGEQYLDAHYANLVFKIATFSPIASEGKIVAQCPRPAARPLPWNAQAGTDVNAAAVPQRLADMWGQPRDLAVRTGM